MDVLPPYSIGPTIENMSFNMDVDETFDLLESDYFDNPMSNSELSQILDGNATFSPSRNIVPSLLGDSNLTDYPFAPQISLVAEDFIFSGDNAANFSNALENEINPADTEHSTTTEVISNEPCSPQPQKRRYRKRRRQLTEAEKEAKREKFLLRNRVAASKCREKRRKYEDNVQDRKQELERQNADLKTVLDGLKDEVRLCKDAIIAHATCDHPDVTQWMDQTTACLSTPLMGDESDIESRDDVGSQSVSVDSSRKSSIQSEDSFMEIVGQRV